MTGPAWLSSLEGEDALDEEFGGFVLADLVIVEMEQQVGDKGGGAGGLGLAQQGHHLVAGLGAGDGDVVLEDAGNNLRRPGGPRRR